MNRNQIIYKECYYALKEISKFISADTGSYLGETLVNEYDRLVKDTNLINPNTLVEFEKDIYFSHDNGQSGRYYKREGVSAHIARNIARSRVRIEESETNPIIIDRHFYFVHDTDVRNILERDYKEIQKGLIASNWKSVIILSGGAIEAILLDLIKRNENRLGSSKNKPSETNITKWELKDLIEVCLELDLVEDSIGKLSHSVRQYRNLIHPGNEVRAKIKVGLEEAKIAFELLNLLIRDSD